VRQLAAAFELQFVANLADMEASQCGSKLSHSMGFATARRYDEALGEMAAILVEGIFSEQEFSNRVDVFGCGTRCFVRNRRG
jgi:hypothetical protein